jgi:predicted N-acetyltransferase YhbS
MPVLIREYRDADRAAVLAAFQSNVPAHFPASEEDWLISALEEPDGPFFVIEDDGEVVGCGGYELSDFYNLGTLVFGLLHAHRHRAGLGRMLLAHRMVAMAADPHRPRYVTIDTHPHVAGFYERHGFHVMARWTGGYRSGRDRVDLRIELTDDAVAHFRAMLG